MKNGSSVARAVYLPLIILLFFFCKSVKEKPQPVIALDDYLGLQVGNSWEYKIIKYELARNPESNSRFIVMDSIIRTKSITSHTDSTWYYSIKDSLFFHRHCSEPGSGYLDTPIITVYRDTCIRHSTGLTCRSCGYGSLDLDMTTHQWEDSITDGDTMYAYFWKMLGPPVDFVYYVKNIGLTMYCHEKSENAHGRGEAMFLIKFNGIGNDIFRLLSNYRIDESYTFDRCAP